MLKPKIHQTKNTKKKNLTHQVDCIKMYFPLELKQKLGIMMDKCKTWRAKGT